MNVALLFLIAAIALFVLALLVVAGAIDGVSNAAFVDSGLACFAASFLPFNRPPAS